jgi:hypothetical protein
MPVTIDRAVEEPGGGDAIVAQGAQEGHDLPAAMRYLGLDPLTARRPAPQRRHVGFGPGSTLPVSWKRRTQLIAVLIATPNWAAV